MHRRSLKGFRGIGLNLKNLVDKDIADHYEAYSDVVSVPDPNIDFRLVPTLEVFFQRNAEVLTTDINNLLAWQPGDIVTFESSHVAIVSSIRNIWGRPYIIQHGKDPAAEEDRIYASDGMEISGHYRWPLVKKAGLREGVEVNEKGVNHFEPRAGTKQANKSFVDIIDIFCRAGYEAVVTTTEKKRRWNGICTLSGEGL